MLKPDDTDKINEDWPVDRWEEKRNAASHLVCDARLALSADEVKDLVKHARKPVDVPAEGQPSAPSIEPPHQLTLAAFRNYDGPTRFAIVKVRDQDWGAELDSAKLAEWGLTNLPTFVLIADYKLSGGLH
jgi:hypothetical protein